jgi:hypothetical protein
MTALLDCVSCFLVEAVAELILFALGLRETR